MITPEDFAKYEMVGEIPSRLAKLCLYVSENYPRIIIFGPRGSRKTCLATEIAEILVAKKIIDRYIVITDRTSLQKQLSKYTPREIFLIDALDLTQLELNSLCKNDISFILTLDQEVNPFIQSGYSTTDTPYIITPEILSWTNNLSLKYKNHILTYLSSAKINKKIIPFRMLEDIILNFNRYSTEKLLLHFVYLENPDLFKVRFNLLKKFLVQQIRDPPDFEKKFEQTLCFVQRPLVKHKPTGTDKRSNLIACEITILSPFACEINGHKIQKGFNRLVVSDGKHKCEFCKKMFRIQAPKEGAHVLFCDSQGKIVPNNLCKQFSQDIDCVITTPRK
ncbi:MAG: hypothetical protein ACMXYF_01790 [Candidatus Woesearchaeota archaeon]